MRQGNEYINKRNHEGTYLSASRSLTKSLVSK
jgi:hypothetical protein